MTNRRCRFGKFCMRVSEWLEAGERQLSANLRGTSASLAQDERSCRLRICQLDRAVS